jgi:hypothetical protein
MVKNKAVDLGISQFMQDVADNKPAIPSEEHATITQKETQEVKRSPGRPAKTTQRSERIIFKLDAKSYTELSMIKALNRLDIQDVVFTATVKFLKEYNSEMGLTAEGVELVKEIKEQYEK